MLFLQDDEYGNKRPATIPMVIQTAANRKQQFYGTSGQVMGAPVTVRVGPRGQVTRRGNVMAKTTQPYRKKRIQPGTLSFIGVRGED